MRNRSKIAKREGQYNLSRGLKKTNTLFSSGEAFGILCTRMGTSKAEKQSKKKFKSDSIYQGIFSGAPLGNVRKVFQKNIYAMET